MKKEKLIALLSNLPEGTEVIVAPCPDTTGWTNDIKPVLSHVGDRAVLCLFEETTDEEELDIEAGSPLNVWAIKVDDDVYLIETSKSQGHWLENEGQYLKDCGHKIYLVYKPNVDKSTARSVKDGELSALLGPQSE